MTRLFRILLVLQFVISTGCAAIQKPILSVRQSKTEREVSEATGRNWMVATQGVATTNAVDRVFREGGNMIDAAIAASFAISVERPHSTGIGGGGFLLYREAKSGKIYAIDFRERAPKAAREKMYLDEKGNVIPDLSITGAKAVAVPGLVRGLSEIHRKFGRAKWETLLRPAIELAENGFEVYPSLKEALDDSKKELALFESSRKIFLRKDGTPYDVGEILRQKDLASTLRKIGKERDGGFYRGSIAREIVKATKGWITQEDLDGYRVKWREPIRSSFRGREIVSMPPPSSGGVHLIEILNLLEPEPIEKWGLHSSQAVHQTAMAMQRAFLDRARYMGDPDFVKLPLRTMTSKEYAATARRSFDPNRATSAGELGRRIPILPEHTETTHFSIMDREGNVVVSTQTINGWFGSAVVAGSTGILLNNEMDDFSAKPGASNLFGAIGSKANSVHPGKTPLSSMSPTIVLENGVPKLAVGAPGGTRIITCVAQTILNVLAYGMPLYDSVAALRIHQQWMPDVLRIEKPGLDSSVESDLRGKGWTIEKGSANCAVMAVSREGDVLRGVSDPRSYGKAFGR